jgi:5-methyltetrahydropteroyltriglutamate--homocysteine methyltransferase
MLYTIVGFPRIGLHRELKFATEAYFRGEKDAQAFLEDVRSIRANQWQVERDAGLSYIPSNDFSLYDNTLDASFVLNAIPARYKALNEGPVATYFAMARGYQGADGDVKAFTMKKWFNTNYHYMVPELDDEADIHPANDIWLHGFRQAKALGLITRPVLVGPFTFLKLARTTGNKTTADFLPAVAQAYAQLLEQAGAEGAQWIQFDEPSLVTDLTAEDIAAFKEIYTQVLAHKGGVKVLLQTYFGDVRDCYDDLCALDFDGIGLDFVESKETAALVEAKGFPADKVLFAGLINGKNIWRANYAKVLDQLAKLKAAGINVVLTTSCSLLHVPYTVANETKLPQEVTRHFAFAYEKLDELAELSRLAELDDPAADPAYLANQELFRENDLRTDKEVQAQVAGLTEADFTRPVARKERQALQRQLLGLPILPTTTIGSFPQTEAVRANRRQWRQGQISDDQYEANIQGFIRDCIKLQEDIGLDVLVHGEFERNDMVEFFGENLSGYVFTENAWVQSYGTRGLKPPIIFGDIRRTHPITVKEIAYANSLTDKDVKGMLTGPVTILNWSFPREDIPISESMYQIALAIRQEVLDLEAAGVRIIQIDEAALREKLPLRKADWNNQYLDFAIRAFRLCHSGVKPQTQIHTHMCYSEFEDIIPAIDAMDADVITFEASRSKLTILDALAANHFETEVGPGVYDIHSPRVPSVEEIEKALGLMLEKIPAQNLWVNPDCGLKTRGNKETEASLRNLVAAAKAVRAQLQE